MKHLWLQGGRPFHHNSSLPPCNYNMCNDSMNFHLRHIQSIADVAQLWKKFKKVNSSRWNTCILWYKFKGFPIHLHLIYSIFFIQWDLIPYKCTSNYILRCFIILIICFFNLLALPILLRLFRFMNSIKNFQFHSGKTSFYTRVDLYWNGLLVFTSFLPTILW